ncbi:chitin deacetylase [Thoreauomyces humboldtii]|nr:chitin deacetylase [Thoreauomyces humboldtii]
MHASLALLAAVAVGSSSVLAATPATAMTAPQPAQTIGAQVAGDSSLLGTAAAASSAYANMPTTWPDPDEAKGPISIAALLNSPLVQAGMALVNATVPQSLLTQPVYGSVTSFGNGTVIYSGDGSATGNCKYNVPIGSAVDNCLRTANTANFQADVTGCPGANTWGFTVDDGPTAAVATDPTNLAPDTSDLLTQLTATNNTKATFFLIGAQSFYHPTAVQAVYAAGHEVAVHTWTHSALSTLTNEQIVAEILFTEALLVRITGVRPTMMRPPYGDVDDRGRAIIAALGYRLIMWSAAYNSQDAEGLPVNESGLATNWTQPAPGFIALDHNTNSFSTNVTIEILKDVEKLIVAGNEPITIKPVGQCLGISPYRALGNTASASSAAAAATATGSNKPGATSVGTATTAKSSADAQSFHGVAASVLAVGAVAAAALVL